MVGGDHWVHLEFLGASGERVGFVLCSYGWVIY